jgi:hypothetical protein
MQAPASRPGPELTRPVLDRLDASEVVRSELYVNGVLHAEASGPAVRWSPGGAGTGGRVQLVAYTRDRHVWPSNIVTLRPDATRPAPPPG